MDVKVAEAWVDRTRARNRAAQTRFRQQWQVRCDKLSQEILRAQQQLAAAYDQHAQCQRRRVDLSTRAAESAAALAAAKAAATAAGGRMHPPAHGRPRDTDAAPAACMSAVGSLSSASQRTWGRQQPSATMRHGEASSAVVPRRTHRTSFYIPFTQPPPPVSSFRCCAAISHEDICAVAGGVSGLIDFTQHSLTTLVDTVCLHKAARLGHAGFHAQTKYEAAPGLRVSASASMSTPECLASYAAQFLLMRLEFILISAASGCNVTQHPSCDDVLPPTQKARQRPVSQPQATSAPVDTPRAPAVEQRPNQSDVYTSSADKDTTADGSAASHTASAAGSTPPQPGALWSGCLRCGTNETHDARAALRRIVRELVCRCCGVTAVDEVAQILEAYRAYLARIPASSRRKGEQRSDSGEQRRVDGGGGAAGFMERGVAAALGAAAAMEAAVTAVADMHVLQQLKAEGQSEAQHGEAGAAALEAHTHESLSTFAMLNCLALPQTSRTIYSLSNYAVFPMTEYCEIESMHVHLYRQLQLTTKDSARLAAHWRQWRGLNGALDASFLESMRLLQSVPTVDGLPAGLLAHIADVASSKRVIRALNRAASAGGVGWNGVAEGCVLGDCDSTAYAAGNGDVSDAPFRCEVCGGDVQVQCGGYGTEGALCLLGCSAQATSAAVMGLRGLVQVHEAHERVVGHMKEFQLLPGVLLGALQYARIYGAHVLSGTAPADVMQLCQLADAQERWRRSWEPVAGGAAAAGVTVAKGGSN